MEEPPTSLKAAILINPYGCVLLLNMSLTDNCQKKFTLKHKKQNMNTETTKCPKSIIKEFSDYTLNNEIENIRQLLDISGEFEIQDEKKDSIVVKKDVFIDWYQKKLEATTVTSVEFDQCIGCSFGKSILIFNNGKFPREIKHNSERSKTGLMLNTIEGKINEIKFCFAFLKTENKYQIEIDRAKKYNNK